MNRLLLLVVGVAGGFLAAHLVNASESGRRMFGEVDRGVTAFTSSVAGSYRAREAELRGDDPGPTPQGD